MATEKNKKDEVYWQVLNCAIELEFKKGHLKWTMTELARKSKITRSLIYYYFGQSKIDILRAAVDIIGKEFTGVDNLKRMELWLKEDFEQSLIEAREIYEKMPHLCSFYLNYREKNNEIGEALQQIEKSFMKKIKVRAPKATQQQINTLFAVYFGIGYSPFVGRAEIKIFAQFIKQIFTQLK